MEEQLVNLYISWLQKLFELLQDNIFLPDTMQEYCRKNRYDFSKHYLNKFIAVMPCLWVGIFSSYLDTRIYDYLKYLKIVDKNAVIKKIKWLDSLHNMVLHDDLLIKFISKSKTQYIYTYKQSFLTDVLAKRTLKLLPNVSKKIQYMSDKKNLYRIFDKKLLPQQYTFNDLKYLDKNKEIIIKPRIWSNSRWVSLMKNKDVKQYLTENNIDKRKHVLQEYISTKISYSMTLLYKNLNLYPLFFCYLPITILDNWFWKWFYVGDCFYSPSDLVKMIPYYDKIQNEIRKKIKYFKGITLFNVEFVISRDKEIKIIEINPRMPASLPIASCIWKLSNNAYIDPVRCFISNKGQTHNLFKKCHALDLLKKNNILYEHDKWEGILPLNFSKKFARIDYMVIWKNKKNHDKIFNIFLSIIK